MNNSQNTKAKKTIKHHNILESLKDISSSTSKSMGKDVLKSQDFINQLIGSRIPQKFSGEIPQGGSLEIKDVFSGKHEENQKLKKQLVLERRISTEEKERTEKKSNELKLQLHAIQEEVIKLSESTQGLAKEVKIAAMQAPVEPGIYHIVYFEKLLEFIKSFRKKVNDASVWLHSSNNRAQKKNYWAKYKKHGSKFLLSSEHYLTRSAG